MEQFSDSGPVFRFRPKNILSLDAIEAKCSLFTKFDEDTPHAICRLPDYMDPAGKLANIVRQRSYFYTEDNIVSYQQCLQGITYRYFGDHQKEIETDTRYVFCSVGNNFLAESYTVETGTFRHGQLVMVNVALRLSKTLGKRNFDRALEVVLRKVKLVGRTQELVCPSFVSGSAYTNITIL